MNTNLELYKTFYHVAKNGNITKAANELIVSQPAVSKSIKTLEEQLNTTLCLLVLVKLYMIRLKMLWS